MAVYGLDIFTAVTMISSDRVRLYHLPRNIALMFQWTNAITAKGSEGIVEVKFIIAKWVFVGCIIFSFLLVCHPRLNVLNGDTDATARLRILQS